jgi:hypothetical protein
VREEEVQGTKAVMEERRDKGSTADEGRSLSIPCGGRRGLIFETPQENNSIISTGEKKHFKIMDDASFCDARQPELRQWKSGFWHGSGIDNLANSVVKSAGRDLG